MNDDNIVFQPGGSIAPDQKQPNEENASTPQAEAAQESEMSSGSPKVFDFSSDLNISPIGEEQQKTQNYQGFIRKTQPNIPVPSKSTGPTSQSSSKALNRLEGLPPENLPGAEPVEEQHEWPFASQETQAKRTADVAQNSRMPSDSVTQTFAPQMPLNTPAESQTPTFTPTPTILPKPPSFSGQIPNANIKNIRTYEGDVAEVLERRGTSKTSISIAESKKRGEGNVVRNLTPEEAMEIKPQIQPETRVQREDGSGSSNSKLILVLVSVILIGIGSIVGYYLYSKSVLVTAKSPVVVSNRLLPSLIPSESNVTISSNNLNGAGLLTAIKNQMTKSQPSETIREYVLTETKEGTDYRISAPEMIALMNVNVPDIIERTLTPQWMLGSYSDASSSKHPFVAVNTTLFQNAFAGMLSWEPTIAADLKAFIPLASTAGGLFKDEIVRNKDVRAYVSPQGSTIFLYSFIDNNTLVIAEDEATLSSVIAHVESRAFVR